MIVPLFSSFQVSILLVFVACAVARETQKDKRGVVSTHGAAISAPVSASASAGVGTASASTYGAGTAIASAVASPIYKAPVITAVPATVITPVVKHASQVVAPAAVYAAKPVPQLTKYVPHVVEKPGYPYPTSDILTKPVGYPYPTSGVLIKPAVTSLVKYPSPTDAVIHNYPSKYVSTVPSAGYPVKSVPPLATYASPAVAAPADGYHYADSYGAAVPGAEYVPKHVPVTAPADGYYHPYPYGVKLPVVPGYISKPVATPVSEYAAKPVYSAGPLIYAHGTPIVGSYGKTIFA